MLVFHSLFALLLLQLLGNARGMVVQSSKELRENLYEALNQASAEEAASESSSLTEQGLAGLLALSGIDAQVSPEIVAAFETQPAPPNWGKQWFLSDPGFHCFNRMISNTKNDMARQHLEMVAKQAIQTLVDNQEFVPFAIDFDACNSCLETNAHSPDTLFDTDYMIRGSSPMTLVGAVLNFTQVAAGDNRPLTWDGRTRPIPRRIFSFQTMPFVPIHTNYNNTHDDVELTHKELWVINAEEFDDYTSFSRKRRKSWMLNSGIDGSNRVITLAIANRKSNAPLSLQDDEEPADLDPDDIVGKYSIPIGPNSLPVVRIVISHNSEAFIQVYATSESKHDSTSTNMTSLGSTNDIQDHNNADLRLKLNDGKPVYMIKFHTSEISPIISRLIYFKYESLVPRRVTVIETSLSRLFKKCLAESTTQNALKTKQRLKLLWNV